jgi:hypothetical protein
MKILNKIDEQIDRIENRMDYVLEGKRKVGGREYDEFFTKMLKKWKIKSYKDLPKNKQKAFFDEVDAKWNAKKETD